MYSSEVINYLRRFLPIHVHTGVFPINQIPTYISKPLAIVINEDPDYMRGSHWVAVFIDNHGNGYYFDSYGRLPKYAIKKFLNKNSKKWIYNPNIIQSLFSTVCGQYCVLCLVCLSKKYTLNNFLGLFSSNTYKNDLLVRKMFRKLNKKQIF